MHPGRCPRLWLALTMTLVAGATLPAAAQAQPFTVNSLGDAGGTCPTPTTCTLRQAITSANTSPDADTIGFSAFGTITLSADLPAVQSNVTVLGQNNTLSGNNQFRGFFVGGFSGSTQVPVTVAIQDLTIQNATARGGDGATGGAGGAGLGGAIFVADLANLTASNVTLTSNAATGGNGVLLTSGFGGGGGMGGNGGTTLNNARGGGGGLGVGANGGDGGTSGSAGIATLASPGGDGAGNPGSGGPSGGGGGGGADIGNGGGGGGGVGGTSGSGVNGGAGGFGGGGGGGLGFGSNGGDGGFGGGGGAGGGGGSTPGAGGFGGGGGGGNAGAGRPGGFGGGGGNNTGNAAGGGGAGMGGALFVQAGGSLTLAGALTVNGNSVTAGTGGGNGATNGLAFGNGIFVQGSDAGHGGGGSLTFSPAIGETQTISDVIADQTGSGGGGGDAGAWGITKSGAGTTVLAGTNTYSGGTTLAGGTLNVSADNKLGGAAGGLIFNGGVLRYLAGFPSNRGVTLNAGGGTLDTNGFSGTLGGVISGTGGLTKTGAGTTTLTGANTYSGTTAVTGGTLQAGANNAFAPSSGHTVSAAGTLDLNGFNQTIGSLAGAGNVILGSASLTAGGDNSSTTHSGVVSGGGAVTKAGTGKLTLSGNNTYNGATTVNAGTLAVTGTIGSPSTTVNSGGTLAGDGTTQAVAVSPGGTVAPGTSVGALDTGAITFNSGSDYAVEIDASGADRLVVTGAVNLGGASLRLSPLAGYTHTPGTVYTIVANDLVDPVVGTFSGLAEGATVSAGGNHFRISYVGGGNDVTLTAIAAPTLSTTASANVVVGGPIHDTAALAGGLSPTGTITFRLYGPGDSSCSNAPVFTDIVTVTGNGSYDSANFTPTQPGTYRWTAAYSGDSNNVPVARACNDPDESVTVAAEPLLPTPEITVTGLKRDRKAGTATLTVTVNLAGNVSIAKTKKVKGSGPVTLTGPGSAELEIVPRKDAAKKLARTGRVTVNPRILFAGEAFKIGIRHQFELRQD